MVRRSKASFTAEESGEAIVLGYKASLKCSELAGEFEHRPAAAVKSAGGDMHSVDALPRRRGRKVEGYRHVAV